MVEIGQNRSASALEACLDAGKEGVMQKEALSGSSH